MKNKNSVFIATSLDGYIADKNGGIDWLHDISNPENKDLGYHLFMEQIDALVMGRNTFDAVVNFDMEWPYTKPVFVLSNTLEAVPEKCAGKVQILRGKLLDVLKRIHEKGYHHLYIDGGKTIRQFLEQDLIDKMVITYIPVLLGSGVPLFGTTDHRLKFRCIHTEIFLDSIVQNHFKRIK